MPLCLCNVFFCVYFLPNRLYHNIHIITCYFSQGFPQCIVCSSKFGVIPFLWDIESRRKWKLYVLTTINQLLSSTPIQRALIWHAIKFINTELFHGNEGLSLRRKKESFFSSFLIKFECNTFFNDPAWQLSEKWLTALGPRKHLL